MVGASAFKAVGATAFKAVGASAFKAVGASAFKAVGASAIKAVGASAFKARTQPILIRWKRRWENGSFPPVIPCGFQQLNTSNRFVSGKQDQCTLLLDQEHSELRQ